MNSQRNYFIFISLSSPNCPILSQPIKYNSKNNKKNAPKTLSQQHPHPHLKSTSILTHALESVNSLDHINQLFRLKILKFQQQIHLKNYKIITEQQWQRIQMESNTSELYQLLYQPPKKQNSVRDVILKIVIKHFTGTAVHISLSSKAEIVKLQHCEYKITGQKIVKFKNPPFLNNKIYLTIHSPNDLNLFKLKYQFLTQSQFKDQTQRLKSSSLKLLRIYQETSPDKEQQSIILNKKQDSVLTFRKGLQSPRSILDRSRQMSAKMDTIQKQKQKLQNAKEKRTNLQVYKQKSKSLKHISRNCSAIYKQYKQTIGSETLKKNKNVKLIAKTICLAKFLIGVSQLVEQRQKGMNRAIKMSVTMKKCSKKMLSLVKELNSVQPNRKQKQLLTVYHSTCSLTKLLHKKDTQSARQIVITCLAQTAIPNILNQMLNQCAQYRRKTRIIQRYWRERNKAQMTMFQFHIQVQSKKFLQKHLYLHLVQGQFFQRNMPHNLAWQYLKETSLKLKSIFGAYYAKLEEIQDTKNVNKEIKEFNSTCLKKYIKPFLEVPKKPAYPVTRYFRDLSILKSMLRSWYQIEYRRYVRRMKKAGKSVPKIA